MIKKHRYKYVVNTVNIGHNGERFIGTYNVTLTKHMKLKDKRDWIENDIKTKGGYKDCIIKSYQEI